MSRDLRVVFVNANSVVSRLKRHYLRLFLDRHSPDVMLVAEHKLNAGHRFEMEGYIVFAQYRRDRVGGGTAVLVRDNIRCDRVQLDLGVLEGTCVRIHREGGRPLCVVSLYCAPANDFDVSSLDALGSLAAGCEVLVGADLNARHVEWGGGSTCGRGRLVREFLLRCPDLDVVPTDGPTRFGRGSASYIDICLASPGVAVSGTRGRMIGTLDYESDHRALEILVSGVRPDTREPALVYDYARMDRHRFHRVLADNLGECSLPVD